MRALIAVAALAACGGPTRPVHPDVHAIEAVPQAKDRPVDEDGLAPSAEPPMPPKTLLPRPPVRLISLMPAELTWPLTVEPSSEPHLRPPIGTWDTLCERRGRLSPATLEYVLAWCRFRESERFDLLGALVALRTSEPGLAESIRHDIANLIVAARVGGDLRAWLDSHHADVRMRDLVVAMLVERGRYDEAIAIDITIPRDGAPGTTCPRELRLAMISPLDHRSFSPIGRVTFRGTACGARVAELDRELAKANTTGELVDLPLTARFVRAYSGWTRAGHQAALWVEVAVQAESALPLPEAERLALAALDNAVRSSCSRATVFTVNQAAARLRVSPHHSDLHDRALAELAALTPERCRTR